MAASASSNSNVRPTASVLIPSYNRPSYLGRCLDGLAAQEHPPEEVLVVWQGDDLATRDAAEARIGTVPFPLRVLHSPERGVVPAENLALSASTGEVVLLIDDDAIPPPDWLGRHLDFYSDPTVGAVGGPARSFTPEGQAFPLHDREPTGALSWFGRPMGNMYDHPPQWRSRPPRQVVHLVGYNMSLRRRAVDRFEPALRPYWNKFELDACLQVAARGYRVIFDYANVVDHHPTNTAYTGGRSGDMTVKYINPAYNHAFILSRWSPARLRPWRLAYLMLGGTRDHAGLLMYPLAVLRYGNPAKESLLLVRRLRATLEGWSHGRIARRAAPRSTGAAVDA